MTALKRRILDREDGRDWVLYGANGAIAWWLLSSGTYGPVSIHSPRPQWKGMEPSDGCPFLEVTCYADAGYLAGDGIGRAWEAAGRDDDVIWRELETWYAGRLAKPTEARS